MKTILIPSLIFVILSGVVVIMIARATASVPITTEVVVLRDITEKNSAQPGSIEIINQFGLTTSPYNGAIFRFSVLSDVSYNQTRQTKIDSAGEWLTNEFDRQRDIKRFNGEVIGILSDSQNDTLGKSHSSVYLPLARELNRLSKSKSQKRTMNIYSDLMENESDVSFYKQKEFNLIQSDPDLLKNILEKEATIPRLDGIEINFIYQPVNAEKDKEYNAVSNFYRKLLEDKGATVTIEANLQN